MGKQVTELDVLPSFTDTGLLPVHNGAGLKKGSLSQLANYLGTKFSNPNLLINPDFKINQRGNSTYTTSSESSIYTVDRWMLARGKATVNSDGTVTVTATSGTTNKEGYFQQKLENAISGAYTVSMEVVRISGTVRIAIDGAWETVTSGKNVFQGVNSSNNFNSVGLQLAVGASITLKYMKLEQGSVATLFIAPNPAEELENCLRFSRYIPTIYCVPLRRYIGDISNARAYYLPLGCVFETKLRVKGTITLKGGIFDSVGTNLGSVKEIDYSTDEIRTIAMPQEITPWTIVVKQVFIDAEIY
jgi:hypothetical protein